MAEYTSPLSLTYLKMNGTTLHSLYACRDLTGTGAAYGNPAVAFSAGVNEWFLMTETSIDTVASWFTAQCPQGSYRIQLRNITAGTYSTIPAFVQFWHGTFDTNNHIHDTATDMRHDHDAIAIEAADQGRLGTTLKLAIDSITGATWDKDTDVSLKGHVDDTAAAHQASAIAHAVGSYTTVGAALTGHESRIVALETGSAAAVTGIGETSGELGMDIYWDAQSVAGIEYYFRYLWKHDYETPPAAYTDLNHERRQTSPETEVLYGSRRFDIAINTESDLVLYYAVGAKGRADASPIWSAVQHCGVIIPSYRSEQILNITDLSWAQVSPATGIDYVNLDTDEAFPTCSSDGTGTPADNWLEAEYPFDDCVLKGIQVQSGSAMSGTATVKYLTTGGATGTFTVSSATRKGNSGVLNASMTAGDVLKIWSLDPKGMGHLKIRIKMQTT